MFRINSDTRYLGEFINIKKEESILDIGTNNGALLLYANKVEIPSGDVSVAAQIKRVIGRYFPHQRGERENVLALVVERYQKHRMMRSYRLTRADERLALRALNVVFDIIHSTAAKHAVKRACRDLYGLAATRHAGVSISLNRKAE